MSFKRILENNQPYHIISRGVEGIDIFKDEADQYRMIFQMFVANIGSPALNLWRRDIVKAGKAILAGENPPSKFYTKKHPPLVDFLGFNLMTNHNHFILIQRIKGGISKYMGKVNGGFAKYFNLRYGREGVLFQSRFKDILIKTERQLWVVLRYVDVNHLDIFQPGWKEKGIRNWSEAKESLKKHQWSSYLDHIGDRCSKLVSLRTINRFLGQKNFNRDRKKNVKSYRYFIENWLKENQENYLVYLGE